MDYRFQYAYCMILVTEIINGTLYSYAKSYSDFFPHSWLLELKPSNLSSRETYESGVQVQGGEQVSMKMKLRFYLRIFGRGLELKTSKSKQQLE